jgi:hypothetical protein
LTGKGNSDLKDYRKYRWVSGSFYACELTRIIGKMALDLIPKTEDYIGHSWAYIFSQWRMSIHRMASDGPKFAGGAFDIIKTCIWGVFHCAQGYKGEMS